MKFHPLNELLDRLTRPKQIQKVIVAEALHQQTKMTTKVTMMKLLKIHQVNKRVNNFNITDEENKISSVVNKNYLHFCV